MRKNLVLIALALIVFSCKREKKQEEVKEKVKTIEKKDPDFQKDVMVIIVEGVFTKDDNFQLLYTEDSSEEYTLNKRVTKKVKGLNTVQELKYVLPKKIFPRKVRLDFGTNKKQGKISIINVTFLLNNKKVEITSAEFLSCFRPTPWIDQIGVDDKSEYNLIVKEIEVNKNIVLYAPYFVSTEKLQTKLEFLQ